MEELRGRLSKAEAEAADFKALKESLESRLAMLASEIERLSHMIKNKNSEIENLKNAVAGLE